MIRSILAILTGIATLTVTSFAIEFALNPLKLRFESLLMFAYTGLCIALGGYVTAWVARRSPVRHALIMGIVQTGLNVMAFLSMSDLAPLRNWIIGIVLTVPAACLGGVIRARHEKQGALRPA
jgi:peptidoglycan/LPS O-acetylase OafA/YrhL